MVNKIQQHTVKRLFTNKIRFSKLLILSVLSIFALIYKIREKWILNDNVSELIEQFDIIDADGNGTIEAGFHNKLKLFFWNISMFWLILKIIKV